MPRGRKELTRFNIGADDRIQARDLLDEIAEVALLWKKYREESPEREPLLPLQLVSALDDLGDVLTCSEEGCTRLCYRDWDFCKRHGEKKP